MKNLIWANRRRVLLAFFVGFSAFMAFYVILPESGKEKVVQTTTALPEKPKGTLEPPVKKSKEPIEAPPEEEILTPPEAENESVEIFDKVQNPRYSLWYHKQLVLALAVIGILGFLWVLSGWKKKESSTAENNAPDLVENEEEGVISLVAQLKKLAASLFNWLETAPPNAHAQDKAPPLFFSQDGTFPKSNKNQRTSQHINWIATLIGAGIVLILFRAKIFRLIGLTTEEKINVSSIYHVPESIGCAVGPHVYLCEGRFPGRECCERGAGTLLYITSENNGGVVVKRSLDQGDHMTLIDLVGAGGYFFFLREVLKIGLTYISMALC